MVIFCSSKVLIVISKVFNPVHVILLVVVLLNGCDRTTGPTTEESNEVRAVMEKRALAIKNQDIELYKSVFLPDYNDGSSNLQMIVEDMAAHFAKYESIEFTFKRSRVDLTMNSARMVGMVPYKTETMDSLVANHEITLFRRVDGQWYISGGVAVGLF